MIRIQSGAHFERVQRTFERVRHAIEDCKAFEHCSERFGKGFEERSNSVRSGFLLSLHLIEFSYQAHWLKLSYPFKCFSGIDFDANWYDEVNHMPDGEVAFSV